jgi:cardiolipin synthase (CMP-forming)
MALGRPVLNIPNLLSLGRALMVPLVVWLIISGEARGAFFVMVAAGATDALDGWLAKRFHWETELGAYLDPLADKLLLVSVFITLGVAGQLPVWLVIMVVARDIMIVAAVVLSGMLERPLAMHPLAVSKWNTAVQIVLALVALADVGFALGWGVARTGLEFLVAALTLASAGAYLVGWLKHMAGADGEAK